jgi:hypothetical protein
LDAIKAGCFKKYGRKISLEAGKTGSTEGEHIGGKNAQGRSRGRYKQGRSSRQEIERVVNEAAVGKLSAT